MRKNLPVTQQNHDYPEHIKIVSTTTSKGVINYANQDFFNVSGYAENELMGQAHNLVRHPDMPQAAFEDLWNTVNKDQPWMGIVKNRCKNGDHYWVDAFVMKSGHKTHGKADLQSVRVKPSQQLVNRAEAVYQRLNEGLSPFRSWHPKHWSLFAKLNSIAIATAVPILLWGLSAPESSLGLGVAIIAAIVLASTLGKFASSPYERAAKAALAHFPNPLARFIYSGRSDELGSLELSLHFQKNKMDTLLWRVIDATKNAEKIARKSSDTAKQTQEQTQAQSAELTQLAASINEMSASVSEVSNHTQNVSDLMQQVEDKVEQGAGQVDTTKEFVNELVEKLHHTAQKVEKISASSESISSLVRAIHGIAEQTNLLALNAAIEAARAGEQGRGFAVVADEVRNLASSTADTTEQIQNAIQDIMADVGDAVGLVHSTVENSTNTVAQTEAAQNSLYEISRMTQSTLEAMNQTASATAQQSQVCEEINGNAHRIQELSTQTSINAEHAQQEQEQLLMDVTRLSQMANDFSFKK